MDRQPDSPQRPPDGRDGVGAGSPQDTADGVLAWLAGLDGAGMPDADRIDLLSGLERITAGAAAAQVRVTTAFADSQLAGAETEAGGTLSESRQARVVRSIGSQVALARRQSPATGDRLLTVARALVEELPGTLDALTRGETTERRATLVARETAVLDHEERAVADQRLGPLLAGMGDAATEQAARRIVQELDADAVVRRMRQAAASRRVSTRPAPDGMAYLTVLGPLAQVVSAFTALDRHATTVLTDGPQQPDARGRRDTPDGRSRHQIMADAALRWLSGRGLGQPQPVEVTLVMDEDALFDGPDADQPVRMPGHGTMPAAYARDLLREGTADAGPDAGDAATREKAGVWLRRLFTGPDGRDLVAMESTGRAFTGQLRRFLMIRDDVCRTPFCGAPIRHLDHAVPHAAGGRTTAANGGGRCARCNLVKEEAGWQAEPVEASRPPGTSRPDATGPGTDPPSMAGHCAPLGPHITRITTPTGHVYDSVAPPVRGWGWAPGAAPGTSERASAPQREDAYVADPLLPDGARPLSVAETLRRDEEDTPAWLAWTAAHGPWDEDDIVA